MSDGNDKRSKNTICGGIRTVAAEVGKGIIETMAQPVVRVRYQPGGYKGVKKNRMFVPNPHYPDGVVFSFPAWLTVVVGIGTLVHAMGGLEKIIEGKAPSKRQQTAMDILKGATFVDDIWDFMKG